MTHGSLVALLLAVAAPSSAAGWSAPVPLSAPGADAAEQQLAVDPDGDAIFTWSRLHEASGRTRIQFVVRSGAGVLGPVRSPSGPNPDFDASHPQVAVDPTGAAVLTWERSDGTDSVIQARARTAAGDLSKLRNVSLPTQLGAAPQVAIDGDGDALITWQRFDPANDRVLARSWPQADALGAIERLSRKSLSGSQPEVAVDLAGDAVFTWASSDGVNFPIQARGRSAAGVLDPIQDLSPYGQFSPEVAADGDGDAVLAWTHYDGANYLIQARRRSASGTLGPTEMLSAPGENALLPQVAIDADGDAVVTWQRFDGSNDRVQARAFSAAGVLGPVETLSDEGEDARNPAVAVDPGGGAIVTWQRSDGESDRIQARTLAAGGELGAVETLSDAGETASSPQIALDGDGDAAVAWQRFDGANQRIEAAFGP